MSRRAPRQTPLSSALDARVIAAVIGLGIFQAVAALLFGVSSSIALRLGLAAAGGCLVVSIALSHAMGKVRRCLDERLRTSEERYEQVEQVVQDGIWDWDLAAQRGYLSPRFKEILGYDDTWQPEHATVIDLIHPEDRDAVTAAMRGDADDGDRYTVECRMRHRDGAYRVVLTRGRTLRGAGGLPVRLVGVISDVTERKQAQAAFVRAQAHLRLTIDNSPMILFALDRNGVFTLSEGRGLAALGLKPGEVVGRSAFEMYSHVPKAIDGIRRALGGSSVTTTAEAGGLAFETLYEPIRDQAGAVVGVTGVGLDVTMRHNAEEALRQAVREKATLLQEIHHRVKNNLQMILSLLHFQAKKVDEHRAQAAFADAQQRLRAMILVHDRLYDTGALTEIDFGECVHALVDDLLLSSCQPSSRRWTVNVEAPPVRLSIKQSLPAGMILVELLTNVLKYAFPYEGPACAAVRLAVDRSIVTMTVSDTGVGLPPGFEPDRAETFGWQLIRNLAQQLDATVAIDRTAGTAVTLAFDSGTTI